MKKLIVFIEDTIVSITGAITILFIMGTVVFFMMPENDIIKNSLLILYSKGFTCLYGMFMLATLGILLNYVKRNNTGR